MKQSAIRPLVWSGLYVLVLLSVMTPLSVLTVHFLMVPGLVLYMIVDRKAFVFYYAGVLFLVALAAGYYAVPVILASLLFMIPAVVMGTLYKKKTPARSAITAGILTLLAEFVLILILVSVWGPNVVGLAKQFFEESLNSVPPALLQNMPEDFLDTVITMMTRMIPLYLISLSFYFVVISHVLGRLILNAMNVEVPRMRPIKEWMLPKSLVWYYLAALFLDMFVAPDPESLLVMILWNLIPVLTFAFVVQAISFLFYVADIKSWNKALPVIGIIMSFLLPSIVSLLGVFDVAFKIRQSLQKP